MIIISLSLSVPAPPATTRRTRRRRLRSGASPSSPPCGRPAGPPAPPPTPATSPWPPSPGCWSRWRAAGREAAWSPSPPSSSSPSQTTEIKGRLRLTSGLFCLISYLNVLHCRPPPHSLATHRSALAEPVLICDLPGAGSQQQPQTPPN